MSEEETLPHIKIIYGEILGLTDQLPREMTSGEIVEIYNDGLKRLSSLSGKDYSRFKVVPAELIQNRSRPLYHTSFIRPKMAAVLSSLEYEYGFHKTRRGELQRPTTIVTVTNSNQLSVTVIPIQQIIKQITDDELRKDVEELEAIVKGSKDKKKASALLNMIHQKSWDVFIALLPIVLEQLGNGK